MGSLGGCPCQNLLGSQGNLVTPQIRNTSDACFPDPFFRLSDIHEKDPAIEENRVFWGCNIRRISVEYGDSLQSDEHQLPIILWIRIDGLNELGSARRRSPGAGIPQAGQRTTKALPQERVPQNTLQLHHGHRRHRAVRHDTRTGQ